MSFNITHLKFVSPFSMIVSGPSGSGKTFLVRKFIENHQTVFHFKTPKPLLKVIWTYGQWQDLYADVIKNAEVEYFNGLPTEEEINSRLPDLIVIDDLMSELGDDVRLANLFTKISHHKNINVIFLTQNLFHQGKFMRDIHLSAHYLVLMKNPRDANQIDVLGRQLGRRKALLEAYKDATSRPYGYLIVDFKQETPVSIMFRSRILPDESIKGGVLPVIYSPK